MTDSERSSSPNESRFEDWLAKSLHRITCPDTLELGEYAVGLLNSTAAAMLDRHLDICPKCRQEVNFLSGFMKESVLSENFYSLQEIASRAAKKAEILIAQLKGSGRDLSNIGWGKLELAGIRGESPRQLVYAVDAIQIVMEIEDDPEYVGRKQVIGMITGLELTNEYSVQLIQVNLPIISVPIIRGANFMLSSLLPGTYQLQIISSQIEIHLHNVTI